MIQENTASSIINNDLQLQKGYDYKYAKMWFGNVIIIVVMCFGFWIVGNLGCSASLLCCEGDRADIVRNVIKNTTNCSQEVCRCIFEDWVISTTENGGFSMIFVLVVVLLIAIAYCYWRILLFLEVMPILMWYVLPRGNSSIIIHIFNHAFGTYSYRSYFYYR